MPRSSNKNLNKFSFKILQADRRESLPIPIIDAEVRGATGRWHCVKACLDSGAHLSFFNSKTMKLLKLTGKGLKRGAMVDLRGRPVPFVYHPIEIRIKGVTVSLDAAFSKKMHKNFNILGMDFFSLFRVTFDLPHKKIALEGPF